MAGQRLNETVRDQAVETALALGVVDGPCGAHVWGSNGSLRSPQHGKDGASALPVRAVPQLAAACRTLVRRLARPSPRAQVVDGALRAPG